MPIPFNQPYLAGRSLRHIHEAHRNGHLSGNGPFAKKCEAWIKKNTGSAGALMTHSGTAALEMAVILAGIKPGDEVIMPSFSFVSTANAVVLRGGVPVFVDIRPDTLNLDEKKVEAAITKKTRVILPVHYAGVACEMDVILRIARRKDLAVIEDAAHAVLCSYKGRMLGSLGVLGAFSFHETKALHSGEGGALLINDKRLGARAEVVSEKGTDRSRFFRGQVDKYTWRDIGSSYLPSELVSAFLWAQLESGESIVARRLKLWQRYHRAFEKLEKKGVVRRPIVPAGCEHNGHIYYLLMENGMARDRFIRDMGRRGVHCVFHYLPLHRSSAGRRYGRAAGSLNVTDLASRCLVRLPLWLGLERQQERVIDAVFKCVA